jgi:hypothetical protein
MDAPQKLCGAHTWSNTAHGERNSVAHVPTCGTESWTYVAHVGVCAIEFLLEGPPLTVRGHISVAYMPICATEAKLSVAHIGLCATECAH